MRSPSNPSLRHNAARLQAARFLAAALLAAASPAALAQGRPVTAGLEQPAGVSLFLDDGTALTANPATLGFTGGFQLHLANETGWGGSKTQDTGVYLATQLGPFAAGASMEWLRGAETCSFGAPCRRRTSYGLALRGGQFALGAAAHVFSSSDNVDADKLSSWDVGAAWRPLECTALGVMAQDLDQPRYGSQKLPTRITASAAVRPGCEQLTVAADAIFTSCNGTDPFGVSSCGAGHPDLRIAADWAVFSGLHLLGLVQRRDVNDQWSGQVGLGWDFSHLGVRYARAFSENPGGRHLTSVRFSQQDFRPRFGTAVELDLDRALSRPGPSLPGLLFGRSPKDPLTLTLDQLDRLAKDDSVRAVVLRASSLPGGMAAAEEIRTGIENLRKAGKKVLFHLENAGDLEYYVATAADRVYAAPLAVLTVNGFSATALFAAAGLDKLGVKAEFFRVGAYKNAPDTFTRSDMSGEQREVTQALLADVTGRFVQAVADRRRVDEARLKDLLQKGLLRPQEAVDAGLLDGLVWPDQLEDAVGKLLGRKVSLSRIGNEPPDARDDRWGGRDRVALVRVEGDIALDDGAGLPWASRAAGARRIVQRIRRLADDPGVSAIVVRIDSPGGDGNASDLIWRELYRARKEKGKPVVASMGDVAASGGYYVAMGADSVYAEPSTVTGSIGVFAGHFDASALLGKLGLTTVTVKTSQSADLFSSTRALTDPERKTLQGFVDDFYETFVSRVAEARKLSREEVDLVARGRVWTGAQAKEKGLVDKLGGLREALVEARRRAGLAADADVIVDDESLPQLDTPDALAGALLGSAQPALAALPKGQVLQALRALSALGEPGTVRARLPYDFELK